MLGWQHSSLWQVTGGIHVCKRRAPTGPAFARCSLCSMNRLLVSMQCEPINVQETNIAF